MSFCVGKEPDLPNMMVSYSAAIAKDKFYNGIMTLVDDENGNFQKIFPNLQNVLKSADTMSLDYRKDGKKKPHSEYSLYCCGFDGGITGRTRAHNVLYVDDLIKNIEEARNRDVLDKQWEEFTGTLMKRMQGNCKMLLIGTIFSLHDPLSRTIKYFQQKSPERIEVVRIPGLREDGESNFANYKYGFARTKEMFLQDKDLMDKVSFECLIQQHPIERLGILFFEEEFKKFEEEPEFGLQRRVAAVDVAWGGGDSLSMPIGSEYNNGDIYLTDVIFSQGNKEETIPLVVNAIIEYKITNCYFEANNGGDMYAEKVQEELKKRNYKCNIHWGKVPTTKSKLDRILAVQGAIRGSEYSEYRLLIKKRANIQYKGMYWNFLEEVFNFNQTPAMQGKQHDDACFEEDVLIATEFGNKKIKDIKIGDRVITPFGLKKVTNCGITGYKETINKFGLKVTPNHKVFNKEKSRFTPIDTLTTSLKCDKLTLGGLIKWKQKLSILMEKSIEEVQRVDTILNIRQKTSKEKTQRNYIEQFGNITMEKYPKDTKYIIKTIISTIITLKIWSVYHLGNIYQNIQKKIGKKKNIEKKYQNKCRVILKDKTNVENGINQKKEENGIESTVNQAYCYKMQNPEFVFGVKKNISLKLINKKVAVNYVRLRQEITKKKNNAHNAEKFFIHQVKEVKLAQKNVKKNKDKKQKKLKAVYNITVEDAGCYYANGILVSNCDSLASLFTNVLGCVLVGKARSSKSREDLGI